MRGYGSFDESPHSAQPPAPLLTLNPYYLSPWGKKKVLGKHVEEGEGLGPRKELFDLAARQLCARSRAVPQTLRQARGYPALSFLEDRRAKK